MNAPPADAEGENHRRPQESRRVIGKPPQKPYTVVCFRHREETSRASWQGKLAGTMESLWVAGPLASLLPYCSRAAGSALR
jgi:hypothetical protein